MSRSSRYIYLDGQFETDVLGHFTIIRGFADLRDLADISVPYEMQSDGETTVTGYQRQLNKEHATQIKKYLEEGDNRFLPEIILSVRTDTRPEFEEDPNRAVISSGDDGILIKRPWKSKHVRTHRIRIDMKALAQIHEEKRIRRIDGNHRLDLAAGLVEESMVPKKYLAPFCVVLLKQPEDQEDNYAESLIFHTINSTALPLESEHALSLILGQNAEYTMLPEKEIAYSPALYLTRILRDCVNQLPRKTREMLGNRPLTSLNITARGLIELDPEIIDSRENLDQCADNLMAALLDIAPRLSTVQPDLCRAEFFIELCARVWKKATAPTHEDQIKQGVDYLAGLAAWLGRDGLMNLKDGLSFSRQLMEIYDVVRSRVPQKVFLARWYPTEAEGADLARAELRLEQIRRVLQEIHNEQAIHLELIDMGTQGGGTFPIHPAMYEAIASADIILVDLTGARPNVCVEAGFALSHHKAGKLIFIFHKVDLADKVPFDLNTFRYEAFGDTGEIANKVKPHILQIIEQAKSGSI